MPLARYFKYLLFSGILFFLMLSCSRDEPFTEPKAYEEARQDSLEANSIDTPAIFIQEELVISSDSSMYFHSDTVLPNNDIAISTPLDYEKYRWMVGNDPQIRKGRKFTISFGQRYDELSIRLIGVTKDGKKDTIYGNITILNDPFAPGMRGDTILPKNFTTTPLVDTFKGYNKSHPNHKFKIWLGYVEYRSYGYQLWFYNLPKGCYVNDTNEYGKDIAPSPTDIAYTAYSVGGWCKNMFAIARLSKNREKIKVKYKYVDREIDKYKYNNFFVGSKID